MLVFNKTHYIFTKVNESTNNFRQLFKLVGNLLGKKDKNPMPPSTSNNKLAEKFMAFFHTKIEKLGKMLKILNHINLHS